MTSKFWTVACLVVFASFTSVSAFAEDTPGALDPASVAVPPLPTRAEWAFQGRFDVGPAENGVVGALDANLAYRPRSLPMVFRLDTTPAAFGLAKDAEIYAGYGRVLVGLSLEYVEVALGGAMGTDAFSDNAPVFGGPSIEARFGRLDGTHIVILGDGAISRNGFDFGRLGAMLQVALPENVNLRIDADLNRAGIFRFGVGARRWLHGNGEAGSFALGGRIGVLSVASEIVVIDLGGNLDTPATQLAGPVIGLDVEYRF